MSTTLIIGESAGVRGGGKCPAFASWPQAFLVRTRSQRLPTKLPRHLWLDQFRSRRNLTGVVYVAGRVAGIHVDWWRRSLARRYTAAAQCSNYDVILHSRIASHTQLLQLLQLVSPQFRIATALPVCVCVCVCVWLGGVVVRALDLRLRRSRVRSPAAPLSGNNLGQVVHIHECASVTKQYHLVPVEGRWCSAAGTVGNRTGHASQTLMVYPPTGSPSETGRWARHSPALLVGMAHFTLHCR